MEDEIEVQDPQNNPEGDPKPQDGGDDSSLSTEEIADLQKRASASSQNYERAKKAEDELKVLRASKQEAPKEEVKDLSLTPKDALLLAKADVDIEDVDEVVDFAKYRKIPVSEALKNSTLNAILRDKKEQRQTAAATQTKSPRTSSKEAGETLLERANQGKLPEREEDIDKLVAARIASKISQPQG